MNRKRNAGIKVGAKRFGHRSHTHKEHGLRNKKAIEAREKHIELMQQQLRRNNDRTN